MGDIGPHHMGDIGPHHMGDIGPHHMGDIGYHTIQEHNTYTGYIDFDLGSEQLNPSEH
jgi:hypothetical protein